MWIKNLLQEGSITTDHYSMNQACGQEGALHSLLKVLSVSHCLCWPSEHLFTNRLLFHLYVSRLLPL